MNIFKDYICNAIFVNVNCQNQIFLLIFYFGSIFVRTFKLAKYSINKIVLHNPGICLFHIFKELLKISN